MADLVHINDGTTRTQRTLMVLVTEMQDLKKAHANICATIEALANQHDVPLPAWVEDDDQ